MVENKIPFNVPYAGDDEFQYIKKSIANRHLSGNGEYTNLCHQYLEKKYGFKKCLLTTSCTDALEMCAILLNIQPGDEVIMPSFTFVSTANAFLLRGAKIILADSSMHNPNIDTTDLKKLITKNTKVIVVVHYAGIACNMQAVMVIARKYNLFVVEDAAQAIDSFYIGGDNAVAPLGSVGDLATFSFHESKNIQCGEGGLLVINNEKFIMRSEIIWEKGTNRASFFRKEVDRYNWVDIGSSFLPSEITAAFLFAQLQALESIQKKRKEKWQLYYTLLKQLQISGKIELPYIPAYATNNAHIFYIVCKNITQRDKLIFFLAQKGVQAMFHYPGLHTSPYYSNTHSHGIILKNVEKFSDCLLRLPLYAELTEEKINFICNTVYEFLQ